jgi:hypothetical protein
MAAAVLASLVYVAHQFSVWGHLPRPFHSDPSQSLMDFYNTAYWANRPGAYTIWHSVYPPLSFVFTRLITHRACYARTPFDARACDPAAVWFIVAFYLLNLALVFLSLRRSKDAVAIPRTLALCLGLPMLYGLELANLIIPCFTFFVLAEGELLRSATARQFCRAIAFNFKLYLLVIAVPRLLRLRVRWMIGLGGACLIVYLITFMLYGSGTPGEIITDLISYARGESKIFLVENHLSAISASSNDIWNHMLPLVLRVGEFVALAGILAGLPPKGVTNGRRLSALALSLVCAEAAIHTQGFSADYTQIFLIFLIFLDRDWNAWSAVVTITAYLLCVSADRDLIPAYSQSMLSFFSGTTVQVDFGLALSQFVRPILLVIIQFGLAGLIWRDVSLRNSLS